MKVVPLLKTLGLLCCICLPCLARGEIAVTDDLGQVVELGSPARRIISLAPNITESLFALDAGDRIVGVDEFSNYPEAAKRIQRVNNHAAANYELILSLQPDLVLAWRSGNGEDMVDRLQRLGLPVFVIEPRRLSDIPGTLKKLGKLTGTGKKAAAVAADYRRQLERLEKQYGNRTPVRVFYQIWNEPLITLNGEHLVSDVLSLCGGENVFADAEPLVPYVSIESVIRANPAVIIASGSSESRPPWLDMWQRWPMIEAVENQRIHHIPPDLLQRHSLRILQGAVRVCKLLDAAR